MTESDVHGESQRFPGDLVKTIVATRYAFTSVSDECGVEVSMEVPADSLENWVKKPWWRRFPWFWRESWELRHDREESDA